MTEYVAPDGVPTYFSNIVTSNLFPDELILEFRRFLQEHKKIFDPKSGANIVDITPPSMEQIYANHPIARVVLTFAAAKSLRDYLNETIPEMEKRRGQ